ncbi:MAG: ATP-binding protein [Desulfurococcales archaeon]|nr:ATP-binding protein [Desulfurococcales archaeon]
MTVKRFLSEAPLKFRLAATIASASLVAGILGSPEPLAAGLIVAAALSLPVYRKLSLPSSKSIPSKLKLPRIGPSRKSSYNALGFEIDLAKTSRSSIQEISKFIADRAKLGSSRLIVASILEGSRSRVVVALSSTDEKRLKVDYEVLKTLISSTVEGVRIRDLSVEESENLARIAEKLTPASRSYPLIIGIEDKEGEKGLFLGYKTGSIAPEKIYLSLNDVEGHISIFGATGTGKSTTLARIACGSAESFGLHSIILDWTGEHGEKAASIGCNPRSLDPLKDLPLNPLIEADSEDDIVTVVDALSSSLNLTEPQEYMLLKVIEQGKPKSFTELEALIESAFEQSRWDREVKKALLRKIAVLTRGASKEAFSGDRFARLEYAPGSVTIVDVSRIPSQPARRAYTLLTLWLAHKSSKSTGKKILVAVDEAHNIAGGEDGLLSRLAAEGRKDGLYLVIATQSPSLIPVRLIANTNTKIIHAIRSHRDLEVVRSAIYLPDSQAQRIPSLDRGEALLHSPSHPQPIFIKVSLGGKPGY